MQTLVQRFMQTIEDKDFEVLQKAAREKRMTVQGLIRSVIIPEFLKKHGLLAKPEAKA